MLTGFGARMAPGRQAGSGRLAVGGQRSAAKPRRSPAGFFGRAKGVPLARAQACSSRATSGSRRWRAARASVSSPAVKRDQIESWVRAPGHLLVEVFEELDESGGRGDRPLLQQVARVERGDSQVDRGGRNRALRAPARPRPQRDRARYHRVVCSAPSRMGSTSRRAPAAWVLRIMLSMATRAGANSTPPASTASASPSTACPGGHTRCAERHGLSHARVARPVGSA